MGLPLDFALEGFRLIRARPRLITLWGVVTLFGYGLAFVMFVATAGPVQPILAGAGMHPPDTISDAVAQALLLSVVSVLPLCWLTQAVIACAVCRAGLEGGEDAFGFLRFGAREMQVLIVTAATSLIGFAMLTSVFTVFQSLHLPAALDGVGFVAGALAALFVQVRLSLNVPQTFALRRIDLFGSVAMTKGRFWPLAGGYVAAFVLSSIVQYLGQQVVRAVIALAFGEAANAAAYDMSSLSAFLTPAHVVDIAISFGLIMPQVSAILLAAPLGAWKALKPAAPPLTAAP